MSSVDPQSTTKWVFARLENWSGIIQLGMLKRGSVFEITCSARMARTWNTRQALHQWVKRSDFVPQNHGFSAMRLDRIVVCEQ